MRRAHCSVCGSSEGYNDGYCSACNVLITSGTVPKVRSDFTVVESAQSLKVVQRWFLTRYIPLAIISLGWNCFFILEIVRGSGHSAWLFLAVGLIFSYLMFAGLINSTILEVTGSQIRLSQGPVPLAGSLTIHTNQVSDFVVETDTADPKQPKHNLKLIHLNGHETRLLLSIQDRKVADFLEQRIEEFLGLRASDSEGRNSPE